MYMDKISDMIAHFIGLFDTEIEEARLRAHYAGGQGLHDDTALPPHEGAQDLDQTYDTPLEGYDPGVKYRDGHYQFSVTRTHHALSFEDAIRRHSHAASYDFSGSHFRMPGEVDEYQEQPKLVLYTGPGSTIAHVSQLTLLRDDDYLNMTDGPNVARDTTYVTERTTEYYNEAARFTPFDSYHRTDTYDGLQSIAKDLHDYITQARDNNVSSLGTGADQDFVVASHSITGTYVNGVAATTLPDVDDFMPDRGIAKPPTDPTESDTPLESHTGAGNSLDVAAGANVVANIVSVVNTGVVAPVMAVMGDYHQIDAITQSYVYSDHDTVDAAFTREDHAGTVANNIAAFQRTVWGESADGSHTESTPDAAVFPTAWRVSYIEGDVSFVHWIEQYHFVSDNDTMTVTTSGADVSVLTGGNSAVNLANFLGIGMQYDLVIVGGNVLDMNMIAQVAVLYDNDKIHALAGSTSGATVQTGNNLIWNEASIHNVGANDRFASMPDYMVEAAKAINERDPHMPEGLSTDPNFAGYAGLNVLYITGNLYDVTYVKQVSVLGDSDDVTQAASKVLANNENAMVHIDTGSNAVVNIAQITDYDSFGGSTYIGGHLYSDAVLIQGGLIENDPAHPHPAALANEAIAFLHDDTSTTSDHTDGLINAGHDLSWSQAHPVDVMQTAVA
ncbi:hypothetical protein ABUK73_17950 [Agrobacterium sp. BA1120]|uniref:hypothetical protein n=1 Tax=Agrobacterium sp. BA1120 TaxID=3228927 RepID=UPI003369FD78